MDKNKDIESIFSLISELSREKPDTKALKTLCSEAGLTYESDLIQLMSKVLVRASSVACSTAKSKKSTKLFVGEA